MEMISLKLALRRPATNMVRKNQEEEEETDASSFAARRFD
jgi:hypothetical protein